MKDNYEKALFIIDMNNGFVNFGPMANPLYNNLVGEQLETIKHVRDDGGLVTFILEGHNKNAREFKTYPEHCVFGTKEAELIKQLLPEQNKENTRTYYKNSINGMLNRNLQYDIRKLKNLKEVIVEGVCADLCVMDFARTLSRYFDEIDKDVKMFAVRSAIDTFDSSTHNRDEWISISEKVMEQAGIEIVDNLKELKIKEKVYKL